MSDLGRWDDREKDDLRVLVRSGVSIRKISRYLRDKYPERSNHFSKSVVHRVIHQLGIEGAKPLVEDPAHGKRKGPPRGPQDKPHYIPEGHELGGVSRLTGPSGELLEEWSKTRVAGAEKLPTEIPPSFLLDGTSLMKRGDGTTVVQWERWQQQRVEQWQAMRAAIVEHVATYVRPAPSVPERPVYQYEPDLITLYPIGDPHIGMLAWGHEVGGISFDLKIAQAELQECMRQLVARSPDSERAIVTNLGDFFHAENDKQVTPQHGNKVDVDGRAGKVARVGLAILQTVIDTALTKHGHVTVRNIPGNHDPNASLWIPIYLGAYYRDEPRVTIEDAVNPYQYDRFGKNLFGWAHGDGCKIDDLPSIMAADVPKLWGETEHHVVHSGHVHHWQEKEFRACVVYTHRTLAPKDAWHNLNGYRSGQALKSLTYHREYGLDSIAIVGIERVRAALKSST